ncbi:hypothetical protein BB540_28620 [Escherichia coli]|nr:hypothetical protein BB553_27135 [Escherichia coli]PBU66019.1 hypothetical protein BB540_28620 [Escherichia coli]
MCHAGFQDFSGRIRKSKWWSWRELNPRPKFLHTIYIIMKTIICFQKQLVGIVLCLSVLYVFKALPPSCRHFLGVCIVAAMLQFLVF